VSDLYTELYESPEGKIALAAMDEVIADVKYLSSVIPGPLSERQLRDPLFLGIMLAVLEKAMENETRLTEFERLNGFYWRVKGALAIRKVRRFYDERRLG
jgi:hypothetical protein